MKHCTNLISECLLSLNERKKEMQNDPMNSRFLVKLFQTRHVIHIYLSTLQSFFYYRVIEKEVKNIRIYLNKRDVN